MLICRAFSVYSAFENVPRNDRKLLYRVPRWPPQPTQHSPGAQQRGPGRAQSPSFRINGCGILPSHAPHHAHAMARRSYTPPTVNSSPRIMLTPCSAHAHLPYARPPARPRTRPCLATRCPSSFSYRSALHKRVLYTRWVLLG